MEANRSGFRTTDEPHPTELVDGGNLNKAKISIQDLRAAIPAYCFKPSLFWSFFYLARDLIYSAALIYALHLLLQTPTVTSSPALYYTALNVYGFCQGVVWTGLWIIAHDCGHSAFSTSATLNDTVGFILHSALLAPYFSWKSTHRRHHIYANHIEKDLNYVPPQRSEYAKKLGVAAELLDDVGQDAPVVLFLRIVIQQLIGWNWYLLTHITGGRKCAIKEGMHPSRHSHVDPFGALFREGEALSILVSDIGCLATIAIVYLVQHHVSSMMFWWYWLPWMWVNHWIVMITYLHHTSPGLPKYSAESWTFLRGATATIDRDMPILNHFFHNISTDHVTHHLFSRIPHYYSPIATKAIVPLLGKQYHPRGTFKFDDLVVAFSKCQWVEGDRQRDYDYGLNGNEKSTALWYRSGKSPPVEYKARCAEAGSVFRWTHIDEKSECDDINGVQEGTSIDEVKT